MFRIHWPHNVWVALLLASTLGWAQVQAQALHAEDAWARATVPGQKSGSAFMTLRADTDLTLTGASSPAAEKTELHTMEQDGDIMRMRALPEIQLPAGQAVHLTPSGTHVMLMNLRAPLVEGSQVPVTLYGHTTDGSAVEHTVDVPVRGIAVGGAGHAHEAATHEH